MNISPTLLLAIGCSAGILFVAVFIVSLLITHHSRRAIQTESQQASEKTEDQASEQ